ncbi:MAG: hypothetical protein GTO53_12900 [Planctomycetales bacterium]|nr:hypothetical protein [Planctomycetales bacterium]NIM09998.1 hypothetical protein [Planctomycetales bacterium]NIN09438.1 hypothetical protein [Planctomycetales bacterium]NIN78547.1 hypothetical protein [Planctomycetales bacterium]NIO35739.1 hypothetical protein [Planctomycetales bacterium]
MYFKVECSHCGKTLKVREEQAGRRCRCPYCKESLVVPLPSSIDLGLQASAEAPPNVTDSAGRGGSPHMPKIQVGGVAASRTRPARPSGSASGTSVGSTASPVHANVHTSDGSDVSLLLSGAIGAAAAVLIFALLYPLHLGGVRLGSMFWDSLGINFPTTLLMCWSFAILALKARQLSRQKSAMMLDLLPTELSAEITLDKLDSFVSHILSLPGEARQSILVNRVLRGIEHFRVRKSAAETVTMMESQSAIDASNVASSYTIVKVFIWAMPILGFIGTVMGVSSAVSGLSSTLENASDVSAVTESMKGVFGGLGTAFDTTLLALIMSLMVKIPTSTLQKNEDGLVTVADEYCNENLLRRLNDGREGGAERGAGGGTGGIDKNVFREAVESAMGTHHAELENWLSRLDVIGAKLTSQVTRGWVDINQKMKEQHETQLAAFHQHSSEHAQELQKKLGDLADAATGIQHTLARLASQAELMENSIATSVSASTDSLQTHLSGMTQGLNGLNGLLESLGDKQVVVQQVAPVRRGWFRRNKSNGQ